MTSKSVKMYAPASAASIAGGVFSNRISSVDGSSIGIPALVHTVTLAPIEKIIMINNGRAYARQW